MSEPEWQPSFELIKTDHGIDGLDAKRWLVARFTTRQKAVDYLKARQFTHHESGWYWHAEKSHRHTMGAISYEIREVKQEVPVDPQ
jgi:hypothetical protein